MKEKDRQIFKRLWAYSRRYQWYIVFSMLASGGVAGADVATARLVKPLIDDVVLSGDRFWVNLVPLIVIAMAVFKGVSRYVQEFYIKHAGQLVVQDIRNDVYAHALSLSMDYYAKTPTGMLMSRVLNDVGYMQRSAADVLVDTLRESFTLIGLTALAFYTDWRLASVAFVVLPVSVLPAVIIGRRIRENTRRGQRTMGNLTSVLQETFSGIKVIKAFGAEDHEIKHFRAENAAFYRFLKKVLRYDSLSAPIIEILASFGIGGVLWYGINRVFSGALTQGELFSFVASVVMLYGPVKRLTRVGNVFQKSMGAAERVFELLDEVPTIQDRPDAKELSRCVGEVVFENVAFAYGKEPVLTDFSIKASPGEVVALVGPSGAGKTTVAGLLSRFYEPTQGTIRIDGEDLRDLSLASLRRNVALVDQETFLFNESILNNIRYGRPEAGDDEVFEAARQAYADDFIRDLPEGYRTSIGDRGVRISGGQRQRLCIARALLRDAPILILDEATSALDTESETMVQKALANLMKNRTTFVIAHRLSTIMDAHKIVVLDAGRVQAVGTHAQLLQQNGLYKRLHEMQFRG